MRTQVFNSKGLTHILHISRVYRRNLMQCFDLSTLWASDSTSAGCVGFQNFLKSHLFYNKLITVDCGRRSLSFFFSIFRSFWWVKSSTISSCSCFQFDFLSVGTSSHLWLALNPVWKSYILFVRYWLWRDRISSRPQSQHSFTDYTMNNRLLFFPSFLWLYLSADKAFSPPCVGSRCPHGRL